MLIRPRRRRSDTPAAKVFLIDADGHVESKSALRQSLVGNPRFEHCANLEVAIVTRDSTLTGLSLRDSTTLSVVEVPADGVLVRTHSHPGNALVQGRIELDSEGYIVADSEMRMNLPGIYAAGHMRSGSRH